jgi:hypothetical protein
MPSDPKPVERKKMFDDQTFDLPPPTCRKCGAKLALTPLGIAEPSVDAVNLANGMPYCQSCLMARV